jgi:hypothetical protein
MIGARWFDDATMKSPTIFATTPDAIFFSPDGTPGGVPSLGRGINNNPHLELLFWILRAINITHFEVSGTASYLLHSFINSHNNTLVLPDILVTPPPPLILPTPINFPLAILSHLTVLLYFPLC